MSRPSPSLPSANMSDKIYTSTSFLLSTEEISEIRSLKPVHVHDCDLWVVGYSMAEFIIPRFLKAAGLWSQSDIIYDKLLLC